MDVLVIEPVRKEILVVFAMRVEHLTAGKG
jgi:hypothetical protein